MVSHTRLTPAQGLQLIGGVAVLVSTAVLLWAAGRPSTTVPRPAQQSVIRPDYAPTSVFTEALHYTAAASRPLGATVTGVLVNHHLLAANFISDTLAQARRPVINRIIILAPNHFMAGYGRVTTTQAAFTTPFGRVHTDRAAVASITRQGIIVQDAQPFTNEHGIYNILPFVRRLYPGVPIVPIITKVGTSESMIDRVATQLRPLVSARTLVIASLDFAHNQTDRGAQAQDAVSIPVLTAVDPEQYQTAFVDSPLTLRLLLRLMRDQRATQFTVMHHSNSAQETLQFGATDVTSHITGHFRRP